MTDSATASPGPRSIGPGWYHDDNGFVRWWDGAAWDAGAPASAPPPPMGGPAPPMPGQPDPRQAGVSGYPYGPPGYGPGYGPVYDPYYAPYATPARTDGRTMAMLAHLGVFFGGFIMPLVIYLTAGKTDPFVRHHSSEALNFSLAYLAFTLIGMVLSVVTIGIGFIVVFPLLMIAAVAHMVFAIMGAVKANQGEWWRYPVNVRFVSGAV